MPAVTVDDIAAVPRVSVPDPTTARQRRVRDVTTAPRGFEGEGFPVRRAFAGVDLAGQGHGRGGAAPSPDEAARALRGW